MSAISSIKDSHPDLYRTLVAYAATSEAASPALSPRTLKTLVHIYKLSTAPPATPEALAQSLSDIQDAVKHEAAFDPETFGSLSKLMSGVPPDGWPSPQEWAQRATTTLRVGGVVFGALLDPPAAFALSMISLGVEESLVFEPNSDSAMNNKRFLQDSDLATIRGISAWSLNKLLDAAAADPKLNEVVTSPLVQQALSINLDQPPDAIEASLPQPVRSVLKGADETQNGEPLSKLLPKLNDMVKSFSDEADKLRSDLEKMSTVQKQNALAPLDWSNADISGAIAVGTFFIRSVLGDSSAANAFQSFSISVQRAFTAAAEYELGRIGTLALTGSLIGAASVLFGLGNSDGLEAEMFKILGEISSKLDVISSQMSVIEQQQRALLDGLSILYREFTLSAAETHNRLVTIQSQLQKLAAASDEQERENDQVAFLEAQDHCRMALMPKPGSRDEIAIRDYLSKFYDHAHFTSKKIAFTGNPNTILTYRDLADEVDKRHQVALLFGFFPNMIELLNIKYVSFGDDPMDSAARLPNPLVWCDGINAYLSVRALAPEIPSTEDVVRLPLLWSEGLRLRKAITTMLRGDVYGYALEAVEHAFYQGFPPSPHETGLSEVFCRIAAEAESQTLTGNYTVNYRNSLKLHNHEVVYVTSTEGLGIFAPDNDPFERALQLGLITKKQIFDKSNSFQRNVGYQILVAVGDRAGQPLVPGSSGLFEHNIFADQSVWRTWNPPDPWNQSQSDTHQLLDACLELIRDVKDWPTLKQNVVKSISALTGDQKDTFEGCAAAFRTVYTIMLWSSCPADLSFSEVAGDIGNATGLYSAEAWIEVIVEILDGYGSRPSSLATALRGRLRERMDKQHERYADVWLKRITEPPAFLDETLKRLAAYMTSRGIAFEKPTAPYQDPHPWVPQQ